jgi:hypothetical protein
LTPPRRNDIVEQYLRMKLFFTFIGCSLLALSSVNAKGLKQIQDGIDEIESKIDDIDLDNSKEDIQADLDDIKDALEDLKDEPAVYQKPTAVPWTVRVVTDAEIAAARREHNRGN